MKSKKNPLPVAPFNLRETGPQAQGALTAQVGFFRFAHGKGSDRRATIDPSPCPHCKGKVEWTLTYRREGAEVVPYMYARCRSAPKSHRWDFTHWTPVKTARRAASRAMPPAAGLEIPPPRPSVGNALVTGWIQSRMHAIEAELKDLTEMQRLASHLGARPPPARVAAPMGSGEPVANGTPPHPFTAPVGADRKH